MRFLTVSLALALTPAANAGNCGFGGGCYGGSCAAAVCAAPYCPPVQKFQAVVVREAPVIIQQDLIVPQYFQQQACPTCIPAPQIAQAGFAQPFPWQGIQQPVQSVPVQPVQQPPAQQPPPAPPTAPTMAPPIPPLAVPANAADLETLKAACAANAAATASLQKDVAEIKAMIQPAARPAAVTK